MDMHVAAKRKKKPLKNRRHHSLESETSMRPKETSVESRDFSSESSPTEKSISRKKKIYEICNKNPQKIYLRKKKSATGSYVVVKQ
jgi:hypothetical protein